MAVNVKMGVDIGGFTAGIKEGQQILKGLNAEMKATDAEFKATGNAEQKMTQQTKNLNSQLNVQRGIFDQAQKALKKMEENGVKPTDAAYQKMYATMQNAKAGMNEVQAQLNSMGNGAETAAGKAEKLSSSMDKLNKRVSLEQVIGGISSITKGLENAAKLAINLGEQIWNSVMDSARWADDTATMAQMYGIDVETFQRMQKLVTNGMDTTVDSMLKAQSKLKNGIGESSKTTLEALQKLGVGLRSGILEDWSSWKTKDPAELFWDAGKAIMALGEAEKQEALAQDLFGKSWHELVPLFTEYKSLEEYQKALEGVNINSEDEISALTDLNDKVGELKGNFDTLANSVMATLAPALTDAAEALNGVLQSVLDYLKTDDGKQMLNDLSTAVSGLFDDLGKIDPKDVVKGFTDVMNTVVSSVQWLVENKDGVVSALEAIVAGWAALKLTGGILEIAKLIQGLTGLVGGTAGAAAAGQAAGSAFATSFTSAFVAAAPVLATVLGVTAVAVAPALVSGAEDRARWASNYKERQTAAETAVEKELINEANKTLGVTGQIDMDSAYAILMGLSSRQNQQKAELYNVLKNAAPTNGYDTWNLLNSFWNGAELDPGQVDALLQNVTDAMAGIDRLKEIREKTDAWAKAWMESHGEGEGVQVDVEPQVAEDAAEQIQQQVGQVEVPAMLVYNGFSWGWGQGGGGTGGGGVNKPMARANGLPYVPYDGYLASLHKGERVVPAREVSSRSYSSNLYVENMNMSGGADAAGLAAAMAAAQRRTMSAYGS